VASAAAGERCLDGPAGAREDREDAITEELAFDGGAGVLADDVAEGGVDVTRSRAEGSVAEALGEGGGVGDVSEEDGGHAGWQLCRTLCLLRAIQESHHPICQRVNVIG